MQVHRTVIDGVLLFAPEPGSDEPEVASAATRHGVDPARFVHESRDRSVRGSVRGLHGRVGAGESMLVHCARGAVHDIVVDARPASPTFGRVASFLLDDVDRRRLLVPAGCLHGFQALTATVDTCRRTDTPHDPDEDVTVAHDDPDLAVRWPLPVGDRSPRDRSAGSWAELCARLGVTVPQRVCAVGW